MFRQQCIYNDLANFPIHVLVQPNIMKSVVIRHGDVIGYVKPFFPDPRNRDPTELYVDPKRTTVCLFPWKQHALEVTLQRATPEESYTAASLRMVRESNDTMVLEIDASISSRGFESIVQSVRVIHGCPKLLLVTMYVKHKKESTRKTYYGNNATVVIPRFPVLYDGSSCKPVIVIECHLTQLITFLSEMSKSVPVPDSAYVQRKDPHPFPAPPSYMNADVVSNMAAPSRGTCRQSSTANPESIEPSCKKRRVIMSEVDAAGGKLIRHPGDHTQQLTRVHFDHVMFSVLPSFAFTPTELVHGVYRLRAHVNQAPMFATESTRTILPGTSMDLALGFHAYVMKPWILSLEPAGRQAIGALRMTLKSKPTNKKSTQYLFGREATYYESMYVTIENPTSDPVAIVHGRTFAILKLRTPTLEEPREPQPPPPADTCADGRAGRRPRNPGRAVW
jgi:hypothetical protein